MKRVVTLLLAFVMLLVPFADLASAAELQDVFWEGSNNDLDPAIVDEVLSDEESISTGQNPERQALITYVAVDKNSVFLNEEQHIVVGSEKGWDYYEDLILIYQDIDSGLSYREPVYTLEGSAAEFILNPEHKGLYVLIGISYTYFGEDFIINFDDIGINAKFGVAMEADTEPDQIVEEETQPVDIDVLNLTEPDSLLKRGASASNPYVVVLDPGHGGTDPGTYRTYNGVTYNERDLVLKIAQYCSQELSQYSDVKVYMTRTTNTEANLTLEQRVNKAKAWKADLIVSFHLNSTEQQNGTANGTEIYYPNSNYNSSVAKQGKDLAEKILKELTDLGLTNRGAKIRNADDGDKYPDGSMADYLGMIKHSKEAGIPCVLIEHAFLNNATDFNNYLSSESKLKALGVADAKGIKQYLGLPEGYWEQDENGWKYIKENSYVKKQWLFINGYWYYFDENGYRLTGLQQIGGSQYLLRNDGTMVIGWGWYDGHYYYANSNGQLQTGWIKDNGKWYYLNSDFTMAVGWKQYAGRWYYLDQSGARTTGWQKVNGVWYYMDANGVMQTGWLHQNNIWYYLTSNGAMATGVQRIGNYTYGFNSSGVMLTGWNKINGTWYYFYPGGNAKTGWFQQNNIWYYLKPDGAMATGVQRIGNYIYGFNGSGVMLTGWNKINGTWYYFYPGGNAKIGWFQQNNIWYYLQSDGAMATGIHTIGNAIYGFNSSGVMLTGWNYINGTWYYFTSSGAAKIGWLQLGNEWYYLNVHGEMQTGWVNVSGIWYYMNSSGVWQQNPPTAPPSDTLTLITGKSNITAAQLADFYRKQGHVYPTYYKNSDAPTLESFCQIYIDEANTEGIRADVAFCQAMLETGYLQYLGDVKISQYNFAGIGATGNGEPGNSFPDVRTGVRAQIQHLKAYASKEALRNPVVDPRYDLVSKGSASYVEWLGIQENPNGIGWASAKDYGYNIMKLVNTLNNPK